MCAAKYLSQKADINIGFKIFCHRFLVLQCVKRMQLIDEKYFKNRLTYLK